MTDIPVVLTAAGAQPTPPATLLAQLIAAVSAINPGFTVLPAGLIEDISSTDVGALTIIDTARIETINSLTPYGANDFLLSELGQIYIGAGSAPGIPTNTSVYEVFSGSVGYVIQKGFVVSDGTYQYIVQAAGVIGSGGVSGPLYCISPTTGSWAVPANSVSAVVTSVPSPFTVTCTNPSAGLLSTPAETAEQYRARVLQAGMAVSTGTTELLKTLLYQVPGVQQNLVSVVQQPGGGWEIIVGGGDIYQVAMAIFNSGIDVSTLVGSSLDVTNITQANPGVVTTNLNHGYTTGQAAQINELVGMVELNGVNFTATVINEKQFSVGIDTTGFSPYISRGIVTPNLRNVDPSLSNPPNVYTIPFVQPPAQAVVVTVYWNTTSFNFVSNSIVAQLAGPAIAGYISGLSIGAPISEILLTQAFTEATATVLDPETISQLTFTVDINGISTPPLAGTPLIYGDPESYFQIQSSSVGFVQG